MTTIYEDLSENRNNYEFLLSLNRGRFLEGECYAFAIALHEGLGWQIIGLMKDNVVWHAGVRSPDGRVHDVRGFLTEEDFGGYFLPPPFNIRDVSKAELLDIRTVDPHLIKQARRFAELLWPELPWLESTPTRVKAFVDELESISRKYGLWICGTIPAHPPRLCIAEGDEGGYKVSPALSGTAYTFNRYLS